MELTRNQINELTKEFTENFEIIREEIYPYINQKATSKIVEKIHRRLIKKVGVAIATDVARKLLRLE